MSNSLFGGDSTGGASTDESDPDESSPEVYSEYSATDVVSGAQLRGSTHEAAEQVDADAASSDTETASTDSDHEEEPDDRPNKYKGPRGTWQNWTADERQLASSLDQLGAGDLSVHLYNTHALKRHLRPANHPTTVQQWQRKEDWIDDANRGEWVPPNAWTAWPLEPDLVPRADERFAPPSDEDEAFVIKQDRDWRPSEDMEDLLMGIVLRTAKRRWELRDWADEEDALSGKKLLKREPPARRTRSRSTSSRRPPHSSVGGGSPQASTARASTAFSKTPDPLDGPGGSDASEDLEGAGSPFQVPVVMADDERASRILKPTIRSLLTRLDGLLMGLYHARGNHLDIDSDSTASEAQAGAEEASSSGSDAPARSREHDRIRKTIRADHKALNAVVQESMGSQQGMSRTPTKRPSKQPPDAAVEHVSSSHQRTHLKQRNTRKTSADKASSSRPEPSSRGKRKRRRSSYSNTSNSDVAERLGLMDWSEVLGTASLLGWNSAVIDRAASRCAELFGEGMSFRTLVEGEAPGAATEAAHYIPRAMSSTDGARELHADSITAPSHEAEVGWTLESLICPHLACPRHTNPFPATHRLAEHIRRIHEEDPYSLKGFVAELCGGVHVDGFLQPIHARRGWRGKDTQARKRRRAGETGATAEVLDSQ